MIRIGVDATGGDYAPENIVKGAIEAYRHIKHQAEILLIGNRLDIIEVCLKEGFDPDLFFIQHSHQAIGMGENPVNSYLEKKDSSIVKGFNMLCNGEIDAFASAGNTGAMLTGSLLTLKPIPGISRPCLPAILPMMNGGKMLMLDVGFNADCKAEYLYQFAILGTIYAKIMMKIENPRVALLNIGAESQKGNLLAKDTYKMLSESTSFNFVGNMEADHLMKGGFADVLVTDGFTGNIVLKQAEGMFATLSSMNIKSDFINRFNYEIYGGTPVLGVLAPVIIAHGASSPKAVYSMILQAKNSVENRLVDKFKEILYNEPTTDQSTKKIDSL